ncbi:lipase 3-like [Phlebotomus argentipes]|uniref:lipase 3-like n=1 Tax=Phlebotomus argentipes TaxID=94469 RepID=UPI002892A380|nr:lipase 3-like [Phlebotomus argentipes]
MLRILLFVAAVVYSQALPAQTPVDLQGDLDYTPIDENGQVLRFLSVTEMIESYGYPVETHVAQTADGYLLTMHRIPYGRAPGAGPAPNKPVVFLQHGLLCSSADWVVIGPSRALAYLLADEGYDVWMGNARGNTHSRAHINLNPDRRAFWDFSWHEIGIFDLPAMIDYTLRHTGQTRLHYAGHSQGTTSLFIMLSLRPEYNNVIKSAHALAPVAFMENLRSPFIRAFAPFVDQLDTITSLLGMNEFMPSNTMMQMGGYLTCRDESSFQEVCANVLFLIAGFNSEQLNRTKLPAIMANTPAGAATRQLVHYGQLQQSGHFRQFDHGFFGNMAEYGSRNPPDYPLDRITAPIALHFSDNDWLAAVVDVNRLRGQLRNLIGHFRVPLASFNHLDFQWAIDIKPLLYNRVISLINRWND